MNISPAALALSLPALLLCTTHCHEDAPADDGALPVEVGGSTGAVVNGSGGAGGGSGTASGGSGGSGGSIESSVITLVHEASTLGSVEAMHAAMAPDGTIYVLWSDKTGEDVHVQVSRSTDGGVSFEAPIDIDTSSIDVSTWEETQPKLGVSDTRVALAFTDKNGSDIWISYSDVGGGLSFGAPIAVGAGGILPKNQFPAVAIGAGDEVWVTWARAESPLGSGPPTMFRMFAARQSEGFVNAAITDQTNGRPCVCCGVEILGLTTGEMVVVFRGWDSPREQFIVTHPGAAGGSWTTVQASNSNWMFIGCPENGSAIAETPGGGVRMAWTDPTSGAPKVWLVDSDDAGHTWTPQRLATEPFPGGHAGPIMAVEPDGRTWLGWAPPFAGTPQVVSSPDGQTFSGLTTLQVEEGLLARPSLVAGASGSFVVGIVEKKQIWLAALE